MSPPAIVKELHRLLGSRRAVEIDTGVTEKVQQNVVNEPGYQVSAATRKLLNEAHERRRPFPLPEMFRLARKKLTELKARPGSRELLEEIVKMEGFLHLSRSRTPLEAIALGYLRVLYLMSKALHHNKAAEWFGGRSAWKAFLAEAEIECERALGLADEHLARVDVKPDDRDMIERLRPFLLINWLQLVAEQAKARYKRTPEEAERLLRDRNALKALREFLEQNPYLWQVAYNGLETASILKSDSDALWFYERLKDLDPGFQSFDYSPGEVVSLSDEQGMAYFCQRYRERLHKPITSRKRAPRC